MIEAVDILTYHPHLWIGITAWDLFGFNTKIIQSGDLATAIRASCTFPLLFQPVLIDGSICIDGGVFDKSGMMALPGVPSSNLVVNILGTGHKLKTSVLPERFKDAKVSFIFYFLYYLCDRSSPHL